MLFGGGGRCWCVGGCGGSVAWCVGGLTRVGVVVGWGAGEAWRSVGGVRCAYGVRCAGCFGSRGGRAGWRALSAPLAARGCRVGRPCWRFCLVCSLCGGVAARRVAVRGRRRVARGEALSASGAASHRRSRERAGPSGRSCALLSRRRASALGAETWPRAQRRAAVSAFSGPLRWAAPATPLGLGGPAAQRLGGRGPRGPSARRCPLWWPPAGKLASLGAGTARARVSSRARSRRQRDRVAGARACASAPRRARLRPIEALSSYTRRAERASRRLALCPSPSIPVSASPAPENSGAAA